jgi:octaprenyl-diphosphate synthase
MRTLADRLSVVQDELDDVRDFVVGAIAQDVHVPEPVGKYLEGFQGKLLRPALAILSARAVLRGYDRRELIALAGSIELIHASSLLHDDTIDGAVVRRGHETAWHRWSNEVSILLGDTLFTIAVQILVEWVPRFAMDVLTSVKTMCLAEAEHHRRKDDTSLTEDDYLRIVSGKTGALMGAAASCGARIAGADGGAFYRYGHNLGIAYQIIDDLIDYVGGADGKETGMDSRQGLVTLPGIYLRNAAPSGSYPDEREHLLEHVAAPLCLDKAMSFGRAAGDEIRSVGDSVYKEILVDLHEFFLSAAGCLVRGEVNRGIR